MRDCPNCSNPIQDEAVYCRHCRSELEPPLWLSSMRRCPYCAEWIETDSERCRYCDRAVFASRPEHASPFVETSAADDFTQELRQNLLDDGGVGAASFSEMVEGEPISFGDAEGISGLDPDPMEYEQVEPVGYDEPEPTPLRDPEPTPLRDPEPASVGEPEPSSYSEPESTGSEHLLEDSVVAASGSSIWMAGSDGDQESVETPNFGTGTGPLRLDPEGNIFEERATSGSESISELRAEVSGPAGRARRMLGTTFRIVLGIAVFAGVIWGLFKLWEGPAGAFVTEALATDVPTITPSPEPTATRRPAPTLPPVTEEAAVLPTQVETSALPDCVLWDSVSLEDEGAELCVYGVVKRWFAGEEIPFVAIFSEDAGTFAIIDRTTTHPVGAGDCILARGTVEIMRATRPDIDVSGNLETCPAAVTGG